MIPAPFRHVRVASVEEAIAVLAEHGDEARLLAGGHSLLPLMKLRLATPGVLVDVGDLAALRFVRTEGDEVVIGALSRHRDLERSPVLAQHLPVLAHVAGLVGDPQVRNRGTVGGSVAHADPAADLPCALLALDATFVVQGAAGRRTIPAGEFFTGFWATAMRADEVLVEIRVALDGANRGGWAYEKFATRSQDWATVAVAAVDGRVALASMADRPVRASAVEAALSAGTPAPEAAHLAAQGTEPLDDLRASAAFRRHLARVLTERALRTAAGRAQASSSTG